MTEYAEVLKRFFYHLLEQMLFIIIALFILMGIYTPLRNIIRQLNKSQDTIRIKVPKGNFSTMNLLIEEDELIIKKTMDGTYDVEVKKNNRKK